MRDDMDKPTAEMQRLRALANEIPDTPAVRAAYARANESVVRAAEAQEREMPGPARSADEVLADLCRLAGVDSVDLTLNDVLAWVAEHSKKPKP